MGVATMLRSMNRTELGLVAASVTCVVYNLWKVLTPRRQLKPPAANSTSGMTRRWESTRDMSTKKLDSPPLRRSQTAYVQAKPAESVPKSGAENLAASQLQGITNRNVVILDNLMEEPFMGAGTGYDASGHDGMQPVSLITEAVYHNTVEDDAHSASDAMTHLECDFDAANENTDVVKATQPPSELDDVISYLELAHSDNDLSGFTPLQSSSSDNPDSSTSSARSLLDNELDVILDEAISFTKSDSVREWAPPSAGDDRQEPHMYALDLTVAPDVMETLGELDSKVTVQRQSKGRWSAREDALLKECVLQYGPKWIEIREKHFPNRNHEALRKRWKKLRAEDTDSAQTNSLTAAPSHDWTREEELLLISLCDMHGTNWKYIQHYFPDRSSEAIRNFWKRRVKARSGGPRIVPSESKSSAKSQHGSRLVFANKAVVSDSAVRVIGV